MHVAVIGAGASGLATARNLLKIGCTLAVFERNEAIGGTWFYTDDVGTDKFGFPVYASMYSGMKTNLPKEVMGYSDFKFPEQEKSYLAHEEVLSFLNSYADKFNLRPHIKLSTVVQEVRPLPKEQRWSLKILDLETKEETVNEFDAVIVCSGHFNYKSHPNIPGSDIFQGKQIHSHEYRKPDPYTGKKVLIIGAGPSGLEISVILSQYAESVSIKTNLPKEVMGYSDYKYAEQDRSYLSQEEVLAFFNKYADDHNLRPHIKLLTPVKEVRPLPNNRWSIKILDLPTKKETVKEFDAVMVCSGHFNEGLYPNIPGRDVFRGQQVHSHDYRKPDPFTGKKVLIIGAGPSGLDMTLTLSENAESVILSHHTNQTITTKFSSTVSLKPDVTLITESGAHFSDGTTADLDCIIYCTGYKYKFPFLHEDCKIVIEDDVYMKPLYKMMINVEYPTMCFTGIPYRACSLPMYDLQIRYYMEYLKGSMKLPSKEKMYEEIDADIERRKKMGFTKKQFHLMSVDFVWDYYKDLSDSAKIENIWPAITKLRLAGARQLAANLLTFRNDKYRIVDKDNFIKLAKEEKS